MPMSWPSQSETNIPDQRLINKLLQIEAHVKMILSLLPTNGFL